MKAAELLELFALAPISPEHRDRLNVALDLMGQPANPEFLADSVKDCEEDPRYQMTWDRSRLSAREAAGRVSDLQFRASITQFLSECKAAGLDPYAVLERAR